MSEEEKEQVVKEAAKELDKHNLLRHRVSWLIQILGFSGVSFFCHLIYDEINTAKKSIETWNYTSSQFPQHEQADSMEHVAIFDSIANHRKDINKLLTKNGK